MAAIPPLAAAVSNAGALGMVTLTWSDDTGAVVRETAGLTSRPFGGNFVLTSDHHRDLDRALDAGLRIVSFMWGDPAGYIGAVHAAGGIVLHTVGSAEEARRAVGRRRRHRRAGLGSRGPRLGPGGDPAAGACRRRRRRAGTGDRGRRDRRRPRSRRRPGTRRPGRLAGHPVPARRRDAPARRLPAPADRRRRDGPAVVPEPLRRRLARLPAPRSAAIPPPGHGTPPAAPRRPAPRSPATPSRTSPPARPSSATSQPRP